MVNKQKLGKREEAINFTWENISKFKNDKYKI